MALLPGAFTERAIHEQIAFEIFIGVVGGGIMGKKAVEPVFLGKRKPKLLATYLAKLSPIGDRTRYFAAVPGDDDGQSERLRVYPVNDVLGCLDGNDRDVARASLTFKGPFKAAICTVGGPKEPYNLYWGS